MKDPLRAGKDTGGRVCRLDTSAVVLEQAEPSNFDESRDSSIDLHQNGFSPRVHHLVDVTTVHGARNIEVRGGTVIEVRGFSSTVR